MSPSVSMLRCDEAEEVTAGVGGKMMRVRGFLWSISGVLKISWDRLLLLLRGDPGDGISGVRGGRDGVGVDGREATCSARISAEVRGPRMGVFRRVRMEVKVKGWRALRCVPWLMSM